MIVHTPSKTGAPSRGRAALVAGMAAALGFSAAWGAGSAAAVAPSEGVVTSASPSPGRSLAMEAVEDAHIRAMIESPEVQAKLPDPKVTGDHVGGPISPNFTGNFVRTRFDGAARLPLRMPDVAKAPDGAAGALVQVTTHSKGAAVTVWIDGAAAPLLRVPRGGVTSTSTVVRWGEPISVRTSAKADVYVVVHGWVLDDPEAGVAAGGVGLAEERVVRLDTRATRSARWLVSDTGQPVQLTGLGGLPTKTSGVVVEAYLEPQSGRDVSLQMGRGDSWREVTRVASRNPVTQLLVLPVSADGSVNLRATQPLNVRLTPLAWLSSGEAWQAPEQAGGFVPIRPDAVNDGRLGKGGVFDVPGIPDATNVIAAVSGQAFGDGGLRISTIGADPHSVTLPVRGPSTGLLLIPDAQDGARISLAGSLEATVNVVGYVRVVQPAGRVARSASDIKLTPELAEGATVNLASAGVLSVGGEVSSDRGIQDVSISLPGYPMFHAEIDHLSGTFSADLRPPAGTHTLTFTATDAEGGSTSVTRTVTVIAADPYAEILAKGAVSLPEASLSRITKVTKSRIFAQRPLVDAQGRPVTAGDVVLSAPFAASAEGLSRLITATAVTPEGITYFTSAPELGQIFEQASLGIDEETGPAPRYEFSDNVSIDYKLPYNFKKDWGSGALTGSVWLNAEASGLVWMKIVIGSTWFFPELDFFDTTGNHLFKADAGANANLDYENDLYSATPFKSTIMAGPVPVVITVPLRVYLDLEGSAEITAFAETTATWRVMYTAEEMWGQTGWRDLEWEFRGPDWRINGKYSADMRLGVEIRPRVTVAEALGVAGPVDFTLMGLKGAGEMEADSNGKREYTCTEPLTLYSNVSMGLDFILFADSYSWPIIEKSEVMNLNWWQQSGCG